MSYQALARKWRPQRFDQLVGQEHIVRALKHGLANDRLHHAMLFSGTRGVGKTTLGRLVAKGLNCEQGVTAEPCGECQNCMAIEQGRFVDLIEVDAASRTKVDDTRELLENVQYAPAHGRYKIYLIDEVHMLSNSSFNALLKTLEEPPEHVRFLLATTDPQKLPITVLSRCLQFHLKRLPQKEIQERLENILREEAVDFDAGATALLAGAADGSLRDGISLLDQAIAYGHGQLQTGEVAEMLGSIARRDVASLLQAITLQDGKALLAAIERLDEQAPDYEAALDELAAMLQRLAVMQLLPEAETPDQDVQEEMQQLAAAMSPEQVQLLYQIAITAKRDLPLAPDPRSGFEMTLLRMLAFVPASDTAKPDPGQPSTQPEAEKQHPESAAAAVQRLEGNGTPDRQASAQVPASPPEPPTAVAEDQAPSQAAAVAASIPELSAENWAQLVQGLGLSGMVDQLARLCAWVGYENEVFQLQLAPDHDSMFSERHRDSLQQALRARFGSACGLAIELAEPLAPTPAAMADDDERQRQQMAEQALANDPRVQALSERLGAQLHPGSVEVPD